MTSLRVVEVRLDTSVGLHLRAREYDPETAQFLTVDPLDGLPGMPVETSPYHYVRDVRLPRPSYP